MTLDEGTYSIYNYGTNRTVASSDFEELRPWLDPGRPPEFDPEARQILAERLNHNTCGVDRAPRGPTEDGTPGERLRTVRRCPETRRDNYCIKIRVERQNNEDHPTYSFRFEPDKGSTDPILYLGLKWNDNESHGYVEWQRTPGEGQAWLVKRVPNSDLPQPTEIVYTVQAPEDPIKPGPRIVFTACPSAFNVCNGHPQNPTNNNSFGCGCNGGGCVSVGDPNSPSVKAAISVSGTDTRQQSWWRFVPV